MIDKSNLDWENYYLLEEILNRHSEWLEYAENHPDSNKTFNITIPCPTEGNPPICINNFGDGPIVEFGPPHFDFYSLSRISPITSSHWSDKFNTQCVDAIEIVIKDIISEDLIATCWSGIIGGCGLLDLERYNNYLERKKNIVSVSWLGTYNYNYNGEWADPWPDN
jgi:hypothetical protein